MSLEVDESLEFFCRNNQTALSEELEEGSVQVRPPGIYVTRECCIIIVDQSTRSRCDIVSCLSRLAGCVCDRAISQIATELAGVA
jgi:hypothetical protein